MSAGKLTLDPAVVRTARRLAARAARPVEAMARTHTTVSVERAVLRLAGVAGVDPRYRSGGIPIVNALVDAVREQVGLEHGVALPVWDAMLREGHPDLTGLAMKAVHSDVSFRIPAGRDAVRGRLAGDPRLDRTLEE